MSVAAVKICDNKIVLGADSVTIRGSTQNNRNIDAKIRQIEKGFSFAGAGTAMEIEMFYLFCKTRKPLDNQEESILTFFEEFREWLKKRTDISKIENSYIVIYKGKAFYFSQFYLKEVKNFESIGAGADFALAALYLEKTVEDAIETACNLSIYCEKPVNIIEEEKYENE